MPADTTTPNLSLTLPFQGELSWDTKVNSNFSILDGNAVTLFAGSNVTLSKVGSSISVIAPKVPTVSYTHNKLLAEVYPIITATGTVTGSFESSLFLNRIFLPGPINLSEVDMAMAMSFPATNQGAGTMSQTFIVYSFGNSTSLASVASVSSTFAWSTGTSTTAGAASLSEFQGGWSGSIIHPLTFASTSLPPGEYVVGNNLDFAQGSSTWTVILFGDLQLSQSIQSVTAFTVAPTNVAVMSSTGLAIGSHITATLNTAAAGNTIWEVSRASSTTSSVASATSSFTFVQISRITGIAAASAFTASGSANVISNVGTLGAAITMQQSTNQSFVFQGTGSTQSTMIPYLFNNGVVSVTATATITSIALTNTVVTFVGTAAAFKPWFALGGA